MAPTAKRDNIVQKRDRYSRYIDDELILVAVLSKGGVPVIAQVTFITQKGKMDVEASSSAFATAEYAQCSAQCRSSASQGKCLVDCVDGYSATAAKVLGCQLLPDGLPY
jgi:hypothetical protein